MTLEFFFFAISLISLLKYFSIKNSYPSYIHRFILFLSIISYGYKLQLQSHLLFHYFHMILHDDTTAAILMFLH